MENIIDCLFVILVKNSENKEIVYAKIPTKFKVIVNKNKIELRLCNIIKVPLVRDYTMVKCYIEDYDGTILENFVPHYETREGDCILFKEA